MEAPVPAQQHALCHRGSLPCARPRCPQVWLASSLLADSLAVAAQTLLARSLAAGQQAAGKAVVRRTLQMALGLGGALALGLGAGQRHVAAAFTTDPAVLRALALVFPAVVRRPAGRAPAWRCCLGWLGREAAAAGAARLARMAAARPRARRPTSPRRRC